MGHGRRQVLWFGVTAHPTAEWIANQITQACGWKQAPRYLIRDRDGAYGEVFSARAVVIAHVRQQHVAQMAFAEYHDMINAFPADRTDQPFCIRIFPRRARRRRAVSDADRPNPADKDLTIG